MNVLPDRGRSGAPDVRPGRQPMVLALTVVIAAMVVASGARAQEPDQAEGYGIYRPAPPPADTARATAPDPGRAAADTVRGAADTSAARPTPPSPAARDSLPPRDSARAEPARPDRARADTTRPDTTRLLNRVEEVPDDTSLTARMDISRGGGLPRREFPNLAESAGYAGRYHVFLDLMTRDGRNLLADTTLLTVLAPTDSAFAGLPPGELERLLNDSTSRTRWIESLLIPGDRPLADLVELGEVPTRGGAIIRLSRGRDSVVTAGGARVIQPNIQARNGILHGVDRVTLPGAPDSSVTSAAP